MGKGGENKKSLVCAIMLIITIINDKAAAFFFLGTRYGVCPAAAALFVACPRVGFRGVLDAAMGFLTRRDVSPIWHLRGACVPPLPRVRPLC